MKKLIISYSFTGNNTEVANSVANQMDIEHIKIEESKTRTMGTIIFDVLFNRKPKVQPKPEILNDYDLIIFFGPVWIGKIATPLRNYLKHLKNNPKKYVFVSVNGGAPGSYEKVLNELNNTCGSGPIEFVDMHISDLMPKDVKLQPSEMIKYKISDDQTNNFTKITVEKINEAIKKL